MVSGQKIVLVDNRSCAFGHFYPFLLYGVYTRQPNGTEHKFWLIDIIDKHFDVPPFAAALGIKAA